MGYILPVNCYTYMTYQMRELDQKQSPHHIEKPFKIVFNKINDYDESASGKNNYLKEEQERPDKKNRRFIINNPHDIVETTGKGGLFNEKV